jgi:hypothetical protein
MTLRPIVRHDHSPWDLPQVLQGFCGNTNLGPLPQKSNAFCGNKKTGALLEFQTPFSSGIWQDPMERLNLPCPPLLDKARENWGLKKTQEPVLTPQINCITFFP